MIIHDDVADDSNGNSSKVHIAQCQQSMSKLKNVAICNMADDGSKKVYAQKNFKNTNFISTDSCYSNTSQRIKILVWITAKQYGLWLVAVELSLL